MKTKALLLTALVGVAAVSANAGVRFGISVGLPLPVVVAPPVVVAASPVVVAAPACPGVGYVWAPGYWGYRAGVRVWAPGCWNYRPAPGFRGYAHYDRGYDRGYRR